jgi:hypothetical protein
VVVLLAIILFAVRNNVAAGDLKVGDCFDVPTLGSSVTVKTVEHHGCTEAHTAEVFAVADYSGSGSTYPGPAAFDTFVTATCNPAFQNYVGIDVNAHPDLTIGYFYPLAEGWSKGDRGVTCYAERVDSAPMTKSVKGSATPSASP